MYRLNEIHHKWQERFELSIGQLELEPGKRYAILGANGSGKSTLLRILADRLRNFEELKQPGAIAYLPQKPYAFDLNVYENIRLGIPAGSAFSRQKQDELIEKQIVALGLANLKEARGHQLSGGEAQRMALARALVINRQVLMLDEPTNALDLNGMILAENVLDQYTKECGCCLLLVSHQISMAQRLCEKLIFLDQGNLEAVGTLASQMANPETEKLRRFLYFEQATHHENTAATKGDI